jgi:hypothetical protein
MSLSAMMYKNVKDTQTSPPPVGNDGFPTGAILVYFLAFLVLEITMIVYALIVLFRCTKKPVERVVGVLAVMLIPFVPLVFCVVGLMGKCGETFVGSSNRYCY